MENKQVVLDNKAIKETHSKDLVMKHLGVKDKMARDEPTDLHHLERKNNHMGTKAPPLNHGNKFPQFQPQHGRNIKKDTPKTHQ